MDTLLALLVNSLTFTSEVETSALVGTLAAVIAAILAGYAGWYATDRVLARRKGAEEDR